MPKKINGLTLKQTLAAETKKRLVKHLGSKYMFAPVLCSKILGDGKQLAYLGTIDQRPYYWLIRIDSKTDLQADDFDLETLLEPLEDDFGCCPEFWVNDAKEFYEVKKQRKCFEVNNYDTYAEYKQAHKYPRLDWHGGHWGTVVNFGQNNPV